MVDSMACTLLVEGMHKNESVVAGLDWLVLPTRFPRSPCFRFKVKLNLLFIHVGAFL